MKTQFAGPSVHIQIIEFLRQLKSALGRLGIRDEGEYWETQDGATLTWHINRVNELIADYVASDPNCRTKVKTSDGRIIDLIQ